MKVYISGQITGLEHDEYTDLFAKAEAFLLERGDDPKNPLKVPACFAEDCNGDKTKPDGSYLHSWACYLKTDLIAMLECDAIYMLSNHHRSAGAQLELYVAERVGMQVIFQQHDLNPVE